MEHKKKHAPSKAKPLRWIHWLSLFLIGVGFSVFIMDLSAFERVRPSHEVVPSHAGMNNAIAPVIPNIIPQKVELKDSSERSVPILMYHYIRIVTDKRDTLGFNLSVTPSDFEKQMTWLEQNHYQTYPLADFAKGKVPKVGKPIVLTFDDGHDDAYTQVLPVLQKHHLTGTFFIVSGFLNKQEYLSTLQLEGLRKSGMEIAAHTTTHIDLATAAPTKQKTEIDGSKQASPVFAYPSGRYTDVTIRLVKEAGFLCAVTTKPGIATEKSPLYELPRVRISGGMRLESFTNQVLGIQTRGNS